MWPGVCADRGNAKGMWAALLIGQKCELGRVEWGREKLGEAVPQGPWRWPPHWPSRFSYHPGTAQQCPRLPLLVLTAVSVLLPGPGESLMSHKNSAGCLLPGAPRRVRAGIPLSPLPHCPRKPSFLLPGAALLILTTSLLIPRLRTFPDPFAPWTAASPLAPASKSSCSLPAHSLLRASIIRFFPIPCIGPVGSSLVRFFPLLLNGLSKSRPAADCKLVVNHKGINTSPAERAVSGPSRTVEQPVCCGVKYTVLLITDSCQEYVARG